MQDQNRELNEPQEPKSRLALQFDIGHSELASLCARMQAVIAEHSKKGLSAGMIAVIMTRIIKEAIDLKFENKPLSSEHLVLSHDTSEPSLDIFKAKIVRGMFLTFIEHPHGLPGLFDTLSGIAASGIGIGSFHLPGSGKTIKLKDLQTYYPDSTSLRSAQIDLMRRFLVPEQMLGFASARLGLYCILTGCSLLQVYAAVAQLNSQCSGIQTDTTEDLKNASEIVYQKFSADSEQLKRFLNQNLFKVLFEELFTRESTVFSIFNL